MTEHTCTKHAPGKAACYTRHGCRCDPCKADHSRAHKMSRFGLTGMVDVTPVRRHISLLVARGSTTNAIAASAGVSSHHIDYLLTTARRTHAKTAAAILAVRRPEKGLVDATGTRRRIRALMAIGWSTAVISRQIGWSDAAVHQWTLTEQVTITSAKVARKIYDELWDQPPPQTTAMERSIALRNQRLAFRKGWAPPMAWDDSPGPHCIDDPKATPDMGEPVAKRGYLRVAQIVEDVAEMTAQGVHPEVMAQRLRKSATAIDRALRRAGRDDLANGFARIVAEERRKKAA